VRTQVKNRVQSLLEMQGRHPPVRDLFGKAGRAWLGEQVLPGPTRESVDQLLRVHDGLGEELAKAEELLRAAAQGFPQVAQLETLPGIGAVLAPVIWSEIGRLERFRSADALVNYTGLVPSLYESGEVSRRGGITHQGSAWLRWALVQAANGVIPGDNPFARRYRRLRRRKTGNVAKTAVARSLARCVYGVLKSGGPYQEARWGQRPPGSSEAGEPANLR
jgi:transposase